MTNSLRDRAAGNEVATTDQDNRPTTGSKIGDDIVRLETQFQMAMPKGVEAAQLVRDALTMLRHTPKLAKCEPATVYGALMTCAQLGLRPGVLGHAWVLPFYDKRARAFKAQLVIGYQGLVDLAHRSGKVASLIARTVFANDVFDLDYGLNDNLIHRPHMGGDRGKPIGYYAIVKLNTGGHAFIFMSHHEMQIWRDDHAMARDKNGNVIGPWRDNFEAMAHKTCVLRLAKWMPKSTDLAHAIEADSGVRVSVDPTAAPAEVTTHVDVPDDEPIEGEVIDDTPQETPDDPWATDNTAKDA